MIRTGRTGRINSWLAKGDRWVPAVFFLCVLGLYLAMLADGLFVDELDVFFGGYSVAKGGDIYKVYLSQHMPFSYYLAAPGALLGARTAWQFRLYFDILLSALWTGIYLRHRKHFSRFALMLLPLFYVVQLRMHSLGTTMISDHWQGIGLVIILLELVRYAEEKKISAGMACMISLGIVLSFGTTFLSAYPLLIVFLGVAAMQAVLAVKKERKLSEMLREDGRLVLICLCPFLLLGLWYAISGNLANAFGGAYDLNVNIYSKYLGGFGSDAGGTFADAVPRWIQYQAKSLDWLRSGDWRWALQIWLQTAALAVFVISLLKEKKRIAGITFLLAAIYAGVRAFDGFHGAPYMAVTCIPMAFCLDGALGFFTEKRSWRRAIPAALALALTLALAVPEAVMVKNWIHVPRLLAGETHRESNQDALEILAEPGERIHTGDLSYSARTIMRNGLKLDEGSMGFANPWFYEYYGAQELAALKENRTRLLVMEPDGSVWGYAMRDYAPDFVRYAEEHYMPVGLYTYVRNEDYPAAKEVLRRAGYGTKVAGAIDTGEHAQGPMLQDGDAAEQRFEAADRQLTAVMLRAATYLGKNRTGLTVQLLDGETGGVIGESALPQEEIKDTGYTRFALKAELEPGCSYTIRIMTDGMTPEGQDSCLHLYHSAEENTADPKASLNGEAQPWNWVIMTEYDPE